MELTTRRLAPIALALLVGVASLSSIVAPAAPALTGDVVDPTGAVLGAEGAPEALATAGTDAELPAVATPAPSFAEAGSYDAATATFDATEIQAVNDRETPSATPAPTVAPSATPKATPAPKAKAPVAPVKAPAPKAAAFDPSTLTGRNHVWIPSLGINRSVAWFSCDRVRPPDNLMYRWGCAGENNVYLLGHAYSAMKPLHDAYVNHTLKVGMKAYYADGSGVVHTFVVKWWKVTLPVPEASWAWDPQPVSSMTLQTCVGANSKYRLMVRLIEVNP